MSLVHLVERDFDPSECFGSAIASMLRRQNKREQRDLTDAVIVKKSREDAVREIKY